MAGQLVQVATNTVSSSTASVTLTGINTDDVYMVAFNNVTLNTSGSGFYVRVTTSGTADSDSEYDMAYKVLRADSSFANTSNTNGTLWDLTVQQVSAGRSNNGILYLYNFNDSSEYSFITNETVFFWSGSNNLNGNLGGGVHTVAETNDGIHFVSDSGRTFESGTFTLYKVV